MRRKLPAWTKILVQAKYPARPLDENERLAVAMGFCSCQFLGREKVFWCDRTKRLTQSEFARVWNEAGVWCDEQAKQFPGFIGLPEQVYSDEPFVTGQKL